MYAKYLNMACTTFVFNKPVDRQDDYGYKKTKHWDSTANVRYYR